MKDMRPLIAITNNNPVFVSLLTTTLQEDINTHMLALTSGEQGFAQLQAQRVALIVVDIDDEAPAPSWQMVEDG